MLPDGIPGQKLAYVFAQWRILLVVMAAAAVLAVVHHNLDELIRRRRGNLAQTAVVEGEHVPFGTEGIVGGAQWRPAEHAIRGAQKAARRAEAHARQMPSEARERQPGRSLGHGIGF